VGVQLVAPAFEESIMLRAGRMFERETKFGEQAPAL
jgi:Asp-tRNA(Asn)/Glu-tRNA(Gln) amidotransferase A subunit family amidase